jgi:hypothetical protein
MVKPEEIAGAADVVVIEVREAHDIERVALSCPEVFPKFGRKIDSLVVRVRGVSHVREINEHLAAITEVDAGRVGIPQREQGYLGKTHVI